MNSKLTVELERLFGETPIVASENGRAEESAHRRLSSMAADSCNGSASPLEILHGNGHLENGKILMNELQQQRTDQFRTEDLSLTSAVEKLSLGGEGTRKTWLSNHQNLMNGQSGSYLNKQSLDSDPSMGDDSYSRFSNRLNNGYYEVHMKGLSPGITFSTRSSSDGHNKGQACNHPPGTPCPVVPVTSEVLDRNSKFFNEFMHSRQMIRGLIGSNYTKDREQFHSCRMQGQHGYRCDCHDRNLVGLNQFEPFGNATFGPLRLQSPKQQCRFEPLVSHHLGQSKYEGFHNGTAHCGGSGISNRVFPTQYVDPFDVQEKSFKQSSPTKFPTRTHGPNGIDCMKVPFVDVEKQKYYVSLKNGFLCQSCCVRQYSLHSTATDCACHENLRGSAMLSSCANRKREIPTPIYDSLDDATGKIYLMAKDQHGCRFLQRMFTEGSKEDIGMIFNEIINHVSELMIDPFGNYLIQKLLDVCDDDQRLQILYKVNRPGELIRISCNMHGTRAVQKLIETLKTPEQFSMIGSLLKPGIVSLMKNVNGNHVAQHCLQFMVPDYIEFLFDAATKSCVEVATDRHGCCVLQKCLSCSIIRHRDRLLSEVIRNALVLSQDQYGNYVIQFAFELARNPILLPWVSSGIFNRLEGHFSDLSIQKYSSNVVERCLYAGEQYLTKVIDEMINDERFSQIMLNPYGNYAVQSLLTRSAASDHGSSPSLSISNLWM